MENKVRSTKFVLEPTSSNDVPKPIEEADRLRLHNLVLQQQVCREQLNGLVMQFLQSPQPRALQDKIEELTRQINTVGAQIFERAAVDPNLYQLNVDTGAFTRKPGNEMNEQTR